MFFYPVTKKSLIWIQFIFTTILFIFDVVWFHTGIKNIFFLNQLLEIKLNKAKVPDW